MESNTFKILQWNTLGYYSSSKDAFPYVDEENLKWENRKPLIEKVINENKSDIYCFEEVEKYDEYENMLGEEYDGIYYKKNIGEQGIAVFINKNSFSYIESSKVVLPNDKNGSPSNQFFGQYFIRHNFTNKVICVIALHLKSKKENAPVRTIQVDYLLEYINSFKFTQLYDSLECQGTIICGDFNAEPEEECIRLIEDHIHSKSYKFNSVYQINKNQPDYVKYTTWKIRENEQLRVIDYLWISEHLKLRNKLDMPSLESLKCEGKGLPSSVYPSDHLHLIAELAFE